MNGYPLEFIFSIIKNRIKTIENRTNLDKNSECNNNENDSNSHLRKKFFVISYLSKVSNKFKKLSHSHGFNIAYKSINKLNRTLLKLKKIVYAKRTIVVYKINCLNYEFSYVGQTKRKLKTRIKEHKVYIRRSTSEMSVVSRHQLNEMHELDWDNVRILDTQQSLFKRRISEMIYIKSQISSINKQSDTESLPDVYLPFLKKDLSHT